MLHGKMYLAESQLQSGTRVRQAATQLQVSPVQVSQQQKLKISLLHSLM